MDAFIGHIGLLAWLEGGMSNEYDDDSEADLYEDLPPCPKFGSFETRSRHCQAWPCDDGYCDEYEDDPINYAPGEVLTLCRECWGTGIERWCAKCG